MTSIEVGKCAECPFVSQIQEELEQIQEAKTGITEQAVNEDVDAVIAPAIVELLRESPLFSQMDLSGVQNEQEVASTFRKAAASTLDALDRHEESLIQAVSAGTAVCNGPLKMRAAKDGITQTITSCNNRLMSPGQQYETVTVRRTHSR